MDYFKDKENIFLTILNFMRVNFIKIICKDKVNIFIITTPEAIRDSKMSGKKYMINPL